MASFCDCEKKDEKIKDLESSLSRRECITCSWREERDEGVQRKLDKEIIHALNQKIAKLTDEIVDAKYRYGCARSDVQMWKDRYEEQLVINKDNADKTIKLMAEHNEEKWKYIDSKIKTKKEK